MHTLRNIGLLLLGCWFGAAIFFSGVVAPASFSVLRSFELANATEIAGAIVSRSLAVVNQTGVVIGLIVLLIAFGLRGTYGHFAFAVQLLALFTMVILTAVGQWAIAVKMHALRMSLSVPIDQLARSDTQRLAFDHLHRYSVMALAIAMLASLIAFVLLARNPRIQ